MNEFATELIGDLLNFKQTINFFLIRVFAIKHFLQQLLGETNGVSVPVELISIDSF